MSSAAAAVLAGASTAASGIVRRARVNSLDGMTRGFRVVSPSGPAAGGTRGRSRSLTSDGLSACYTSGAAKCVTARGRDALEVGLGGGRGGASGAGGAGAGTGEGGQFLAGGRGAAAAAALAVFAATPDSGENEWGHDKTGGGRRGSGGLLGGRSNDTAWCHVQQPTPPVPSQQEQQQQQRRQLSPPSHEHRAFRATVARGALGAADHNSISSSSSSGSIGHRCRPSEADDFRAQKNLESFRAMKLDGGSTSTMVAATASLGVAGTPQQQQQQQQQQPEGPARITDVYDFDNNGQPVGRGNRSTVSTATHRLTGQPVAVKRMLRSETSRSQVMEEVNMLEVAGAHPNIVTMQAFFEDQDSFYIVMEMCQGGELYHRLADKGRYSEGQAARIMAEVAEAVGFLHRKGIVHFDLKPENIMLAVGDDDRVPEVRLADFGSAFMQHRQICTARDYTVAYSAPEVLTRQAVDEKVDMWALGVVMWVILTGRHPFGASVNLSEAEVARRLSEQEPDLRSPGIRHVSPEGKDLVRRLLAKDPEDRPSAHQMLSHPWLRAVMTRAKVTSQNPKKHEQKLERQQQQQEQQRRRQRMVEAVCAGSPVSPAPRVGVEAGEEARVSPPRRRRQAVGTGQLEEGGGVGASVAAATVAAVASVTGGDHLSA